MKDYLIYCGGKFISTNQILNVYNPYNNKLFAYTYYAGTDELERAIKAARNVAEELRNSPSVVRYNILKQIAEKLKDQRDHFAQLLCLESAKPLKYALGEIDRAIQTFIVAAEESKRLPKEYLSLDWTTPGIGKEGFVKYFPVGLVAGISPFNFPMNLAVHKIAPAIASGCPIILKPSSSTPLSTLALAKIIDETDLPKGAVSILPMDRKTGNQLVTDDRIKLLTFTGSPEVGWKMKQQAGKKKVVLELGGNAGVIVTESANLDLAVQKCLVGGFAYSGQVCIHAQRIFVSESVFDQFLEKYIPKVESLKSGDPTSITTDISVMIDENNALRVENWITEAIKEGAKVLTGGSRENNFIQPTVMTNTKNSMKVCSLEVFGPVVVVEPYKNFDEAINSINDSNYGLQAGVFSNRHDEINRSFNELEVGGVIINDVPTFRVDHMPYGGVKDSGLGREGVKYAILDMMEPKILVTNVK